MLASAMPMLQQFIESTSAPLDSTLERFVGTVERLGWPCLRHPLVYAVPLIPVEAAGLNKAFAEKRAALRKAVAGRRFAQYVTLYERPYRIEAIGNFLRRHPDFGLVGNEREEFWDTVAWAHSDSENIGDNLRKWTRLWTRQRPALMACRHLASGNDWAKLAELGDRIEVFHGNTVDGAIDLSWTLCYDTAVWFAHRFYARHPVVYHGWVKRSDVIAYLTGRGEEELVIERRHVQVHTVESLRRRPRFKTESVNSADIFRSINERSEA